ncbi:MAG: hypothetical protein JW730_00400 [Anaerolineales bacterium]|nr:hypothetical protein [Anaerolineales bacterium]
MTRRSLLLLLLLGILSASCAPSGAGQGTPDVDGTIAANAQTMVAALFQTQTALAPAATNTAIPTATSVPSSTALTILTPATVFVQQPVYAVASATPTGPTPTPLASSLGVGCYNLRLINSWTEPDSPLLPDQKFTQKWQVENNGTCDWLYVYEVVFASGDKLGEATSVRIGKKIEPGKWTTFAVAMRAPKKSGTFTASWRMTDGAGTQFGAVLPVSIKVSAPTNTPKPTATNTSEPPTTEPPATEPPTPE